MPLSVAAGKDVATHEEPSYHSNRDPLHRNVPRAAEPTYPNFKPPVTVSTGFIPVGLILSSVVEPVTDKFSRVVVPTTTKAVAGLTVPIPTLYPSNEKILSLATVESVELALKATEFAPVTVTFLPNAIAPTPGAETSLPAANE